MNRFILVAFTLFAFASMFTTCSDLPPDPGKEKPDTTSHNFTWQTFILGDGNSSVLYDIAIIDDNNIWAVGEIYQKDSSGQVIYPLYNVAHWNGTEWNLDRVTVNFRGNLITPPLEGIFAFSPNQIWLVGSLPIYGDGTTWTIFDLRSTLDPNVSVSKGWGSNPQDIYFTGRAGSIVRYRNGSWQKLSSGTTLSIRDVWGSKEINTDETEILAVASDNTGKALLRINSTTVSRLPDDGLLSTIASIWFDSKQGYYIAGGYLFKRPSASGVEPWDTLAVSRYYLNSVRGNGVNDIVVVGAFGALLHFNGSTWKDYAGNELPQIDGTYYKVSIEDDVICAVGEIRGQAIVVIGKR